MKKGDNTIIGLIGLISLFLALAIILPMVLAVDPTGGSVTEISSGRAPNDSAGTDAALAGNVSLLSITGYSITQSWQGYYGNVTGTIFLADASDEVFYNWSLASPEGEVYASTNVSFTWTNVQCFNFTATGNTTNGMTGETAGSTNLFGMNLSGIEALYGIASDDVDGVNETFDFSVAADTHDAFFTASQSFTAGECLHAKPFSDGGASVANQFEEALLYEAVTDSIIFTSILEEANPAGFNAATTDFEMLVLENGHGTDIVTTTYYFFVELE